MSVTLNLPPDVEAGLSARAQTRGLPLEDYLVDHVMGGAVETPPLPRKMSIVELFAPIRGLDLDFSRNPSTGRPVDL